MDTKRLLTGLSNRIILQFIVVCVATLILLAINYSFIWSFYFENQQTNTGLIINGAIAALLVFGLGNIFYQLVYYRSEEAAMARLVHNIEGLKKDLTEGLRPSSVISQRYHTMQSIHAADGELNHGALASMLNADQSTRFGLVRFINNILILTGVFGTIVSLSIALLGASDLIESATGSLGGMGLVIYGMSTALSTTMTAIVSYLLFGYFFNRLTDVQTHFLSGVEQLTLVYLMPRFAKAGNNMEGKLGELIKSLVLVTDKMSQTQETYQDSANTLQANIEFHQQMLQNLSGDLQQVKQLLREGFRLPDLPADSNQGDSQA